MTAHPARRASAVSPRRRVCWRSDDGSGSILTLAVAGVVVVLAAALGLDVQATVARTRAQSVADLSALAAARQAQRAAFAAPGAVDPCGRAGEVAAHNGGTVVRCTERTGGEVAVEAAVSTPLGTAHATALAGARS